MTNRNDIARYNQALPSGHQELCDLLQTTIQKTIPAAKGRIWHGHPVWFLEGNPVVGYSTKARAIELLFWSGQSFPTSGLLPVGKYKAAGISFAEAADMDIELVGNWLVESAQIQWDYQNLPQNRSLDKRTDF